VPEAPTMSQLSAGKDQMRPKHCIVSSR